MDRSRLSAAVYKKTGIVIDPDGPAFALVELDRLVVEEAASRLVERLETLSERIQSSANALAAEVGAQGVQRVVEMLGEARRTIASDTEQARERVAEQTAKASKGLAREVAEVARAAQSLSQGHAARARWLLTSAMIGAACCTIGFAVGEIVTSSNVLHLTRGR
jgi:hypothetical protein